MNISPKQNKYDVLLIITFLIMMVFIGHYYPVPQSAWDTSYYVERSVDLKPHMRPIGYALLVRFLYIIPNLYFIVLVQFLLYFIATFVFTKCIQKVTGFGNLAAYILNTLLLAEPAGLYFCMNVLSDVLFSCLTLFYLSALIHFLHTRKGIYIVIHALLIFACLQTRLLALFYPVFSCIVLIVVFKNKAALKYCFLIIGVLLLSNFIDKQRSKAEYGISVVSPFSGWTAANNAMYVSKALRPDPAGIKDSVIRNMQVLMNAYFDTSKYQAAPASSDYLWEGNSPLNYMAGKAIAAANGDYMLGFYNVAPVFQEYGDYIIRHYPVGYFKEFIVPNFSSLITPHDGEMMDYYQMSTPSPVMAERYHVNKEYFYCKSQVYKDHINKWNTVLHQIRLILFVITILVFGYFLLKKKSNTTSVLGMLILFALLYYAAMLYSSRLMPRYIIPALQVQTTVIFLTCLYLFWPKQFLPGENR